MRTRTAQGSRLTRAAAFVLAAAVWLTVAVPALANGPNPEQYPEAAERYSRNMSILFYSIIGCVGLIAILVILAVVLIIRWIVRSRRKNAALTAEAALPTPPETP